ncbi:hypothetical protein [Azospirillum doebereinerae]|uniref:hypothetical protein n=1 Tax=Azospirillum doebereinerae TaxID=92933 RepID=UPI00163D17F0|nr:hypothetical protein [Azospirillum doebereinerae]
MIMVKPKMESGGARASDSLERALASGVALEVRTTVHPALLDAGALSGLTGDLLGLGVVRPCALQPSMRWAAAMPLSWRPPLRHSAQSSSSASACRIRSGWPESSTPRHPSGKHPALALVAG